MSKLRSMIVREESLATLPVIVDLINLSSWDAERKIWRPESTILGDLFEAFLGALLLDKGVEAVKSFLYQVMIPKVEAGDFERSDGL